MSFQAATGKKQHPVIRAGLVTHARKSIKRGSRSFATASGLFDRQTRERVWLLYAWCRACDDLADGQDHGDMLGRQVAPDRSLAAIRMLTKRVLSGEITGNPSFDALGVLVREIGITHLLTDDIVTGFALDAQGWRPRTEADMLRYCYHVAGAVGVLMALVMGVPPEDNEILDRACDLGIAFQLANILRDLSEDDAAGRCYLPTEWLVEADIPPGQAMKPPYRERLIPMVHRLCELERIYEASARGGVSQLRFRQRWAVLSAAGIYGAIAREVERRGLHAWDSRVTTSRIAKFGFVLRGFGQALVPPRAAPEPPLTRRDLVAMAAEAGQ